MARPSRIRSSWNEAGSDAVYRFASASRSIVTMTLSSCDMARSRALLPARSLRSGTAPLSKRARTTGGVPIPGGPHERCQAFAVGNIRDATGGKQALHDVRIAIDGGPFQCGMTLVVARIRVNAALQQKRDHAAPAAPGGVDDAAAADLVDGIGVGPLHQELVDFVDI